MSATTFVGNRVPQAVDAVDVARAQRGDTRAFERLYRANAARVWSLARRMIGPAIAGEITQDVFVRVWEKIGTFRGDAAFSTWVHRVAVNVILHRRAALRLERERFDTDEATMVALPAGTRGTDAKMDVASAIEKLPQGARAVFVLHDVEGYKHEEIAELLGVTSGTSKAQLHRARMILRRHLCR